MKRILVPTDFSEHAKYASKVAAQIARKNNAEIYLLNLLDLPSHMNDAVNNGVNIPEVMLYLAKTKEKLAELTEASYFEGLTVHTDARLERAFDGIVTYSKEKNTDLIVMGSHGASGFQEMFIGSNTEKVVRASDIPVIIIKSEMEDFKIDRFVFASDFSNEIKKPFLKLVEFANLFEANLDLVMINTPNSFKTNSVAENIMQNFMSGFSLNNYSLNIYNDMNVEKGIINYANKTNADLIGIATHGRTGLAHFFNGSVSEDIVNHAIKPVITFRI
ncbi:universal stress protein [Flavobacterium sp.]|uniref:universal stress protein n=1 Tax=Flavobacterium sp. TaxID=239 RepID=UPI00261FC8A4|nr:universal stress protein [Flavobacterium sp.]MDD3003345.1 universal stress protein [Flavobacterium sp.]